MATSFHPNSLRYDSQSVTTSFSEYEIYVTGHDNLTISLKNNGAGALAGMELIGYAGPDTNSVDVVIGTADADFAINNSTGLIKFVTSAAPTTLASGADYMMGIDCRFFQKLKFKIKSANTSSVDLLFYLN